MTVEEIVQDLLCLPDPPRDEDAFINDLGANSLDIVELAIEVEETFDIEVSDDEIEKIQTVGDLRRLVEAKS